MLASFDVEATGLDVYHGAEPFLVTMAFEGEDAPVYWEWDVDPLTRIPIVPLEDLDAIEARLEEADELSLQNPKFDVGAMRALYKRLKRKFVWPWKKTRDTLLAAHLLDSKMPMKDLTSLVRRYLNHDISAVEKVMEKCVKAAIARVKRERPKWRFAREFLSDMPTAGEKTWKFDMWMCRAVAKEFGLPKDHEFWTATSDYAVTDSASSLCLYPVMEKKIKERGLWEIYKMRLKLPRIVDKMENRGVTLNGQRLHQLREDFRREEQVCINRCTTIAESHGYTLTMPKGAAVNKSLHTFCFDVLGLPKFVNPKAKTDAPSLASKLLEDWIGTADKRGMQARFVRNLLDKRKRATACQYMDGYERYWIPLDIFNEAGEQLWFRMHPSLNSTGSDTLRWTSSNPNEQNISKKEGFNLRYLFGPAPGREWWSSDAKNIELRLPAYESGEQDLIDLFERSNEPPYYGSEHILNFSAVYEDLWAQAVKDVGLENAGPHVKKKYASTWYQWCKNGDFAVGYGAIDKPGGTGTADRAFHMPGAHARLKSRFAKKEALNQHWVDFAKQHGYVETMPDKTVCPERGYPLVCTRTEQGRILPTVPLNYHIQGTAMWWMCMAMIRVQEFLDDLNRRKKGGFYMVMQVHDELVFDFPQGTGPEPWKTNLPVMLEVKRLMEKGGEGINVPTPVSLEYHAVDWSEGLTMKV